MHKLVKKIEGILGVILGLVPYSVNPPLYNIK
jgi:hypothetical protein